MTCPNCDARYRLPDDVSVVGKRMRCADCEHRWTIEAAEAVVAVPAVVVPEADGAGGDADADAGAGAVPVVVVPEPEPGPEPEPDPEPEPEPEEDEEAASGGFGWLIWLLGLLVLLVGGFVALVALERIDPARVPLVGDLLARVQPGQSPLVIEAEARLTPLPGGALLLEVSGTLRNTGRSGVAVTALKATLGGEAVGGGGSVARRWTIALPVSALAPGETTAFSSTLTGVPGGATQLRITTG